MRKNKIFKAVEELSKELEMIEGLKDQENPRTRRIAIRSIFASIEALCSLIMAFSLPLLIKKLETNPKFSKDPEVFFKVCALSDMSYIINDKGEIKIEPLRSPMKNKLLFALSTLAFLYDVKLNPKKVVGWEKFLKAIKIRNRITHPATLEDLNVSKNDYEIVVDGLKWVIICNHRACGFKEF